MARLMLNTPAPPLPKSNPPPTHTSRPTAGFESYLNSHKHQARWIDTLSSMVCNVDCSSLFVHFGGALRTYIHEQDVQTATLVTP